MPEPDEYQYAVLRVVPSVELGTSPVATIAVLLSQPKGSVLPILGAVNRPRREAAQDFLWALLNSREFLFNH